MGQQQLRQQCSQLWMPLEQQGRMQLTPLRLCLEWTQQQQQQHAQQKTIISQVRPTRIRTLHEAGQTAATCSTAAFCSRQQQQSVAVQQWCHLLGLEVHQKHQTATTTRLQRLCSLPSSLSSLQLQQSQLLIGQ
jgi:hypothetical protein